MYKSPIDIIYGQMETKLEGTIMKAVQNVHVNVDKEELIRALQYDRGQYKKGYMDAMDKQKWIPVTERLPDSEKCVLVYSQDGGVAEGKYNARFKEWVQFRWNVTELNNVTHWTPLPEPPKGE